MKEDLVISNNCLQRAQEENKRLKSQFEIVTSKQRMTEALPKANIEVTTFNLLKWIESLNLIIVSLLRFLRKPKKL
jgi:hypothetical protein